MGDDRDCGNSVNSHFAWEMQLLPNPSQVASLGRGPCTAVFQEKANIYCLVGKLQIKQKLSKDNWLNTLGQCVPKTKLEFGTDHQL